MTEKSSPPTPDPTAPRTPSQPVAGKTLKGLGEIAGKPQRVEINIGARLARSYPLLVGCGVWTQLSELLPRDHHGLAVISDKLAWSHLGETLQGNLSHMGCRFGVYLFPPGDRHKSRTVKAHLEDQLFGDRWGRDVVILAVGGGVVTDMAGFVAATYLRGVRFVSMPTTLLAMVDASIGGKTGVNTPAGKNLVGAFHQPEAVIADLSTLYSLPDSELDTGLVETVKHAMMADADLLGWLLSQANAIRAKNMDALTELVIRSATVKAGVVARDELDHGVRQILNFGHTVGHGIEKASGYQIGHGEAVSVGMAVEADAAVLAGMLAGRVRDRLDETLESLALPRRLPPGVPVDVLMDALTLDKKVRQGKVRFALPDEVGSAAPFDGRYTTTLPRDALQRALEARASRAPEISPAPWPSTGAHRA